jgi:hypothetical protein
VQRNNQDTRETASRIFYELERKRLVNLGDSKEVTTIIKMVLDTQSSLNMRTDQEGKEL